jgi:phage terminase large subunit
MNLNFECSEKQAQVVKLWSDTRHKHVSEILYGGAKAGGKSYLMCMLLAGNAILYPDTRYFIARAELKDLRQSTTMTMRRLLKEKWGLKEDKDFWFNGQDNFWMFSNGSRIDYVSAKFEPGDEHYSRFGSFEYTQGAIEEAGDRIEEKAKNNLKVTLGRYNNDKYGIPIKLLITCNPARGFLFDSFYKPHKEGLLDPWKAFIQAFPQDNPFLSKDVIDNMIVSLSYNDKQRLLYGVWEFGDDPSILCEYLAICDAFTNEIERGSPKRISADIALQGRDRFVVGLWHGPNVVEIVAEMKKSTPQDILNTVKTVQAKNNVGRSNIVADSDGVGAFVSGFLQGIKEFHGNAQPTDKEYFNLKTQCAYKLAELINERKIKIICTAEQKAAIMKELNTLKALDTNADEKKKRIIPKDEMKRLLDGSSPDYLDVLIMGMYFHVKNTNYRIEYV